MCYHKRGYKTENVQDNERLTFTLFGKQIVIAYVILELESFDGMFA